MRLLFTILCYYGDNELRDREMEFDYKGYKLQVQIFRLIGYADKFRLKGFCLKVGFEFMPDIDEYCLDKLKDRFKERVDSLINEVKVPVEKLVEPQPVSIGEKTLRKYLEDIINSNSYKKDSLVPSNAFTPSYLNERLQEVADLFVGVLPYNLSDIKKRYFALLESKERMTND